MARVSTGMEEFDRVVGGGILPGAAMLLTGDPGIGKSTLLLQVALHLARHSGLPRITSRPDSGVASAPQNDGKGKVLYISGEESEAQIKLRVDRLSKGKKQQVLNNFFLLSETQERDPYRQSF